MIAPAVSLRAAVVDNLVTLGRCGWDARALLVLRAAAPTVARADASLLASLRRATTIATQLQRGTYGCAS